MAITCPTCRSPSTRERWLPASFIKQSLRSYFPDHFSGDIEICDYTINRCDDCDLVFSDPMQPGSNSYYTWVTQTPKYYPAARWEWDRLFDLINGSDRSGALSVVDAGCGNGSFLAALKARTKAQGMGLDTTQSSIDACVARGLDGVCMDIEQFADTHPDRKFDLCVSFHCIEHVSDPLSFVKGMKRLLKDDGKLIISAPFSPMSFESSWFDPQNHPPHHMTRWNARALGMLAKQLDMKLTLLTEPGASALSRTFRSLDLEIAGGPRPSSKLTKLGLAVRHPVKFARGLAAQIGRPHVNGRPAGDTFLAIFER